MRGGAVLPACALAGFLWAPAQERDVGRADRGVLAVVRQDGVMVPFAALDGDRWRAPWPLSLRALEVPITLEAVPERWWGGRRPGSWRAYAADGTSAPLELEAPVAYPVYCEAHLGIRTNHRRGMPPPPPPDGPYPKAGVAASDGLALEPVEIVDRARYSDLAVALVPVFDRAEDQALRRLDDFARWHHPYSRDERRTQPVRLETWYRSPLLEPGWTISYIEAVRSYPPRGNDEGCGLETFFRGWIQNDGKESPRPAELSARITYCDRSTVLYMLPFGRLEAKGRLYWIFQLSGWDQEWYEVVEVAPKRLEYEVEYYGGGRGRC